MFPLDQEMEEQEHLTKALVVLCQERGHPDTLVIPEGRDEIGTARCHWERSSLEKPLGAMRDLLCPACSPGSALVSHIARVKDQQKGLSRRIFSSCFLATMLWLHLTYSLCRSKPGGRDIYPRWTFGAGCSYQAASHHHILHTYLWNFSFGKKLHGAKQA